MGDLVLDLTPVSGSRWSGFSQSTNKVGLEIRGSCPLEDQECIRRDFWFSYIFLLTDVGLALPR